eukprot:TRINITY_DN1120_c0_g3_i1.p1 TRINITY_DN1120_c0_g3~~TRINITY_DN1120_c0_g3_i1.p1  ORF type:complete len:741 (-),score=205.22 TRINITY_DN1120_c0_g3_i1:1357-3492(-)
MDDSDWLDGEFEDDVGDDASKSGDPIGSDEKEKIELREVDIFVVDVRNSMHTPFDDDTRRNIVGRMRELSTDKAESIRTPFEFAMECVHYAASCKIMWAETDFVGVYFLRSSPLGSSEEASELVEVISIGNPYAKMLQDLRATSSSANFVSSSGLASASVGPTSASSASSSSVSLSIPAPTSSVLSISSKMLQKDPPLKMSFILGNIQFTFPKNPQLARLVNARKKISWFTVDDSPCHMDDHERTFSRVRDMAQTGFEFHVYALRNAFNMDLFWGRFLHHKESSCGAMYVLGAKESIAEDILEHLRVSQQARRSFASTEINFIGNEGHAGISVRAYKVVQKRSNPKHELLYDENEDGTQYVPVHSERFAQCCSEEIDVKDPKENVARVVAYGGGENRAVFRLKEWDEIRKLPVDNGILVFGFLPRSCLRSDHNIRTSLFIYPNERKVRGSISAFQALMEVMQRRNLMALCRVVLRDGGLMRWAAAIPESRGSIHGISCIPLPFLEEVRTSRSSAQEEETFSAIREVATEETMVDHAKNVIRRMFASHFQSGALWNPSLRRLYGVLHAKVLGEDDVSEAYKRAEKELDVDPADLVRIQDVFDTLRRSAELAFPQSKTSTTSSSRRGRSGSAVDGAPAEPSRKRAKRSTAPSFDDIEAEEGSRSGRSGRSGDGEYSEDVLRAMRVPELKEICDVLGLPKSGRKNDLIDRIMSR